MRPQNRAKLLKAAALTGLLAACSPAGVHVSEPVESAPPAKSGKTEVGPFANTAHPNAGPAPDSAPPLLPNLGNLHYPVTTSVPAAQRYFDQGLTLAYAFNHGEAQRAFREAQRLDPTCALCYWGEALVLGPNINAPMAADAVPGAMDALQKAQAAAPRAAPRERGLIAALSTRYRRDSGSNRAALDTAYAGAMSRLARRHPDDDQIAVLYAEALMDLSPWNYWEAGGSRPKGRTVELLRVLERVLQRNPNHPGAIHYYIHAVEASSRPERAETHAERLAALVPGAGHLVHMPAHIYFRVGRYRDSIAANRQAVAADEAYFAQVGRRPGIYGDAYYPHNIHFLMNSAQMAGDGATALEAANKLAALVSDETARAAPIIQPIRAAPLFAQAQFGSSKGLPDGAPPAPELPYLRAVWHYARGMEAIRRGESSGAAQELAAIEKLKANGDFKSLIAAGIPASDVVAVAAEVLKGRIAASRNDWPEAAKAFQSAAERQERLPYMEPPFWYYPVRQSLGNAYLNLGDDGAAERCFRDVLKASPNNGWALFGLKAIYTRRDDGAKLRDVNKKIAKVWLGDPAGPDLNSI